jgi:uncharacterized LabA/DUF88 family protein
MPDHHYLFIDGGYLRSLHAEALSSVFGQSCGLNLYPIRNLGRVDPFFQRVFYYDCLQDIPKVNETEEQLKSRIGTQQAFFDQIQTFEGFHIRLGSLSGASRRLRQKEVDILLAVDALEHAFHRNMTAVTLLTGDLDFAPLVEALVRLGTWVEILYDSRSVAKRLLEVADKGLTLTLHNYYEWSESKFQASHSIPKQSWTPSFSADNPAYRLVKSGNSAGQDVHFYQSGKHYTLQVVTKTQSLLLDHDDATILENYFTFTHGPIVWK